MKILFLDVDGVLNCTYTFQRVHDAWKAAGCPKGVQFGWPLGHLDEQLVARLNPIIERTGCKIVVSSSWRLHPDFNLFAGWLAGKGFKYPDAIIARTPSMAYVEENARGIEIKTWLDQHPEVTAYAILDDDCFDIAPVHPNNYVATNGNEGLTAEKMEAVITMLSK